MPYHRISVEDRLLHFLDRSGGPDACWPFMGGRTRGHGAFSIDHKNVWAHRIAYRLWNGEIPEGAWVLHACNNGACCNPAHLELGDRNRNAIDRQISGGYVYGRQLPLPDGWRSQMGNRTEEEVFWERVDRSAGPDACWPWTRGGSGGYGLFKRKGKNVGAHRLAWELTNGPIPSAMFIRHTCDNPPCCNPAHLLIGTTQDNTQDRNERGRTAAGDFNGSRQHPERLRRGENHPMVLNSEDQAARISAGLREYHEANPGRFAGDRNGMRQHPELAARGEANGNSKLTANDVREIRAAHAAGESIRSLGRRYPVDRSVISDLINGYTWKHVT